MAAKIKFTGVGVIGEFKNRVCFTGPIQDYTLCGITLDGDSGTAGDFNATNDKCNCYDCLRIVNLCKSIKKNELIK